SLKRKASPRQIVSRASVTRNDGMRSQATAVAVMPPVATPTMIAMPVATSVAPMPPSVGSSAWAARAARTPESATTDPTDRSMPPVRMTAVVPTDMMPTMATESATLTRLASEKNVASTSRRFRIDDRQGHRDHGVWSLFREVFRDRVDRSGSDQFGLLRDVGLERCMPVDRLHCLARGVIPDDREVRGGFAVGGR